MSDEINPRYVDGEPVCSGEDCDSYFTDDSAGEEVGACCHNPAMDLHLSGCDPCIPALRRDRDAEKARADKAEAEVEQLKTQNREFALALARASRKWIDDAMANEVERDALAAKEED